jgi:hypothetical protein
MEFDIYLAFQEVFILPFLKQDSTFSGNSMTLVENVKFLDQVDATLVMTKAGPLRRHFQTK